jgi:hypothetical protein
MRQVTPPGSISTYHFLTRRQCGAKGASDISLRYVGSAESDLRGVPAPFRLARQATGRDHVLVKFSPRTSIAATNSSSDDIDNGRAPRVTPSMRRRFLVP